MKRLQLVTLHPFQFLNSNVMCACVQGNTQMFIRYTKAFFVLLRNDGENIKCCVAYAFTKVGKCCLFNTFKLLYRFSSSSTMVRYAIYKKFSIQVKALPKLLQYEKYGTQKVVLGQNIALSFTSCYICLSPSHSLTCHIFHIAFMAML